MRRLLVVALTGFSLILVGCGSRHAQIQSFRYHENAKQKPVAVLVPLIVKDKNQKISWNVSNEITSQVQRRLVNRGEVFLNPLHLSDKLKAKIEKQDLISLSAEDLAELKSQNEYVIFMELIEHQEFTSDLDYKKEEDVEFLSVKVRLRVFDLREKEPKVLLQEILHYKPYIPAVERETDYTKVVWGGDSYPASLYGRTHTKLEKDLVHQIETYISISK